MLGYKIVAVVEERKWIYRKNLFKIYFCELKITLYAKFKEYFSFVTYDEWKKFDIFDIFSFLLLHHSKRLERLVSTI